MAADWSQVPADILWNIIKRLPMADYIRFGGVCVPWCSTLAEKLYWPAPEPPLLMLPGDGTGTNDGTVRFFSLTEKKDYRMRLPEIRDLRCLGSSDGFLIYVDEDAELHMLDPISGARVDLPSITTLPRIHDVSRDSQGRIDGYMYDYATLSDPDPDVLFTETCHFRNAFFKKVIVSPGSTPESYTVVVIYRFCAEKLAFARAGDKAWNLIETAGHLAFLDVIFHNELLYVLDYLTTVLTINLNHPSRPIVSFEGPGPVVHRRANLTKYLVVLSGELLLVLRFVLSFPEEAEFVGECKTIEVWLRKMDSTSHKWVEAKSIGNHALFLGHSRSVSFSTRDFPQLKPNCIYFTDDNFEYYIDMVPPYKFDTGVYDIEDGSMKPYYPPDSILNWPPPIWFTPNMRNLPGT